MARPDQRPMARLPMLEPRRDALEKCVFCPKLCRSACPVSNADTRETVTPWGKMSLAYFNAHGDVPRDASYAQPAWACTGCMACRESCDHRNDVASTLYDARAALHENGVSPEGARRTILRFAAHAEANRQAVRDLAAHPAARRGARDMVLVGCGYARGAAEEARDAVSALAGLLEAPVAPVEACCGLPLLMAGDAAGFLLQARQLAEETRGAERLFVVDAGCAMALRVRYPRAGVTLGAAPELLVERAARELGALARAGHDDLAGPVRYHDPCQLARGLGITDAPRAVLSRILGRAPDEFVARGPKGACSGAGGLLPSTMPEVAQEIARTRLAEHASEGGGRVVTACASSLLQLRKGGGGPVDDLVRWIARAVLPYRARA